MCCYLSRRFLYDSGCLQIVNGDQPLSKEEVYSLVPDSGYILEHCICYNHLRRLGYAVLRFSDSNNNVKKKQNDTQTSSINMEQKQELHGSDLPCRGWWPPCDTPQNLLTDIIIQRSTINNRPQNYCQLTKIPQRLQSSAINSSVFMAFSIFHMQGFTKKNSGVPAFNIAVVRYICKSKITTTGFVIHFQLQERLNSCQNKVTLFH